MIGTSLNCTLLPVANRFDARSTERAPAAALGAGLRLLPRRAGLAAGVDCAAGLPGTDAAPPSKDLRGRPRGRGDLGRPSPSEADASVVCEERFLGVLPVFLPGVATLRWNVLVGRIQSWLNLATGHINLEKRTREQEYVGGGSGRPAEDCGALSSGL